MVARLENEDVVELSTRGSLEDNWYREKEGAVAWWAKERLRGLGMEDRAPWTESTFMRRRRLFCNTRASRIRENSRTKSSYAEGAQTLPPRRKLPNIFLLVITSSLLIIHPFFRGPVDTFQIS